MVSDQLIHPSDIAETGIGCGPGIGSGKKTTMTQQQQQPCGECRTREAFCHSDCRSIDVRCLSVSTKVVRPSTFIGVIPEVAPKLSCSSIVLRIDVNTEILIIHKHLALFNEASGDTSSDVQDGGSGRRRDFGIGVKPSCRVVQLTPSVALCIEQDSNRWRILCFAQPGRGLGHLPFERHSSLKGPDQIVRVP
jgi:hypothetical protein